MTRGATKLPCGCQHTDTEWIVKCDACVAADALITARWRRDRERPMPIKVCRRNGIVYVEPNNEDLL